MKSNSELRRLLLASALLCVAPLASADRKPPVERFDAALWRNLLRSGPRPAAYVFTTTYCPTCPAVFEQLHAAARTARRDIEIAAVLMDAQGARARSHAHHYAGMTRLYAFDGFEPEIRHAVDPRWRNITPYVVLIDRHGADARCTGSPSEQLLQAWLA